MKKAVRQEIHGPARGSKAGGLRATGGAGPGAGSSGSLGRVLGARGGVLGAKSRMPGLGLGGPTR